MECGGSAVRLAVGGAHSKKSAGHGMLFDSCFHRFQALLWAVVTLVCLFVHHDVVSLFAVVASRSDWLGELYLCWFVCVYLMFLPPACAVELCVCFPAGSAISYCKHLTLIAGSTIAAQLCLQSIYNVLPLLSFGFPYKPVQ